MTIIKNWLIQAGAVIAHSGVALTDLVPADAKTGAVLAIAAVQAVSALIAHYRNPDGTRARSRWEPKS